MRRISQLLGAVAISVSFLRSIAAHAHATQIEPSNYVAEIGTDIGVELLEPGIFAYLPIFDDGTPHIGLVSRADHLIASICASLSPRMKSGSGMKPTEVRYFLSLPPVSEIAHLRKARIAFAVAGSGCVFETTAYS
jgi:hypothetical protein